MKRLALAATLLAVALSAQQLASQQPPVASTPMGQYIGVGSCVNSGCHGSTEPLNASRVLQNEFNTSLNNDPPAGAYNILLTDRAARIARNMRMKKKAWEEKICLDCHTTNVPVAEIAVAIDPEDG